MERIVIKNRVIKDLLIVTACAVGGAAVGAGIGTSLPDVGQAYITPAAAQTIKAQLLDQRGDRDHVGEAGRIQEDDPRWDCHTMGNLVCGPDVVDQDLIFHAADTGRYVGQLIDYDYWHDLAITEAAQAGSDVGWWMGMGS